MSNQTTKPQTTQTAPAQNAIQRRPASTIDQVKAGFEKWKPALAAVLPKHLSADRIIKLAVSALIRDPNLQECTPSSIIKATVAAAEAGLEVGSFLGEAYFVPFNNKKRVKDGNVWKEVTVREAQMIPGYKGLIKLARQTGDISDIYAVVVDQEEHAKSMFRVKLGLDRDIEHTMLLDGRSGQLFAVYAVVRFKDGSRHFEVLTKQHVDAIRARSKASTTGPWVTDYDWMARKTAIKQALKTVTLSPDRQTDRALATAVAADDAAETGDAFRSDLVDAIDVDGELLVDAGQPGPSRVDAIGEKLGVLASGEKAPIAHDPVTGEVKEVAR